MREIGGERARRPTEAGRAVCKIGGERRSWSTGAGRAVREIGGERARLTLKSSAECEYGGEREKKPALAEHKHGGKRA